jgi:L-fuconolactonase
MVVDSHVHFWDPHARRHAWLDGHPSLERRFGPEDYDPGHHEVDAMIFVQADCRADEALNEARWVADLAALDPRVSGIVAYAPIHLGAGAAIPVAAVAALPGTVGVRRLLQDESPSFLSDRRLAEGVRLLADHGLSFDLCVRHHQLRAVSALVAACPEVTFVLDHLGKPPVGAGRFDRWRDDLESLAAHGHVRCKLSGLATEAPVDWRPADLRPYVEAALDLFGPYRCMVGSDWPVCTVATTAEAWFDVLLETLAPLAPPERDAVLYGTACSTYRIATEAGEA